LRPPRSRVSAPTSTSTLPRMRKLYMEGVVEVARM
jgi:hypothetical protein